MIVTRSISRGAGSAPAGAIHDPSGSAACGTTAQSRRLTERARATAWPGRGPGTAGRRGGVHGAFAGLSPPLRDALVLRAIEGLDYAAIADALELPLGTVKSRIRLALKQLRRTLEPAP